MAAAVLKNVLVKQVLGVSQNVTLLASVNDNVYNTTTVLNTRSAVRAGPCGATITISAIIVFKAVSVFVCPVLCRGNAFMLSTGRVNVFAKTALRRMTRAMNTNGTVNGRVSSITVVMGVVHMVVLIPILLVADFVMSRPTVGTKRRGKDVGGISVP